MGLDGLSMFIVLLIAVVCVLIGIVAILIYQRSKGGMARLAEDEEYKRQQEEKRKRELQEAQSVKLRDFMEFDRVEDDMIVQNDGTRYVMAIRCMGINYDLMSEPEMLAVEEGFANFLNTLKFPIQLYVQARSLDLSEGINLYRARLDVLKKDYEKYREAVDRAKATNPSLTSNQRQQMDFEVRKKRTLLEYGNDIVGYIEKMSLNRNILQRKYYIIISYETNEMGMSTNFTKEEAKDVAYSELYTRCKTIQAAISPCGVESTILKSDELAELLYIAYNKDDADMYDVKRAINSGFYRLYSTAPSVMDKKKAALDAKMKEEAITQAELALKAAMDGLRNSNSDFVDISVLTEQQQYEDDTKKEAMQIILENQDQFEPEVVDKALEDLNNSMHKPLVSQEELDEAEGVPQEVTPTANDNPTSKESLNEMLTGNPLNNYLG